ncbi:DUF4369 domain-containing protein [Lutibacter sp. B1]|uniref:DUF4369 domain-containing protein n=1 Tax=Lutibacter sp. B1 TaxID=2725996 RepID=UPI0014562F69|nr:DUF4369 domain-containing protein [Lutibacter sp. B1]NLP58240.1 DUF4369 domain-containing protein [Lutibacter sp. B1]
MKKLLSYLTVAILLFSCSNNKKGNMLVNGTIEGLKKGTVYLQKYKDTLLISVDSVKLDGKSNFTLTDEIESPEIYIIALDKIADEKISFFGEKGTISVNSKLSKLSTSAKIEGSKNQEIFDEHLKMVKQFNGKQLDLFKEKFDAQKNNDSEQYAKIEKEEESIIKRKFLYTTNFAVKNANYEVAPYIALTELYNANIKLLDTINNSLSKEVKASKYGKQLQDFISKIKETEK